MKDKATKNILLAFNHFLLKVIPQRIMCDNGSEFTSKQFVKLCKDSNISIDYVNTNNHLIPHVGNRLGIVDRFIQTLRKKIQLYLDEYDTNKYIDVLDMIVENINNTFNSGIKSIPNHPNKQQIKNVIMSKYRTALLAEKIYNVGDNVRCVTNSNIFEKGAKAKWSLKIYKIIEKKSHSYLLNNDKWYKYYQIKKVNLTDEDIRKRDEEMKQMKKQIKVKRKLNQEGIQLSRIVKGKRKRKRSDRLKMI